MAVTSSNRRNVGEMDCRGEVFGFMLVRILWSPGRMGLKGFSQVGYQVFCGQLFPFAGYPPAERKMGSQFLKLLQK